MKIKMLALAALSSTALLSGSVLAEPSAEGSKTFTFIFSGTVGSELSISLNNADNIALSDVTQVPFYLSSPGLVLDGVKFDNPTLSATTLKDAKIMSNDPNARFDMRMRNSKVMTFDDSLGGGPEVCTNQCGNSHFAWFSGEWGALTDYQINGKLELVRKGITAGTQIPQFNLVHERTNPRTDFAKGTYTEEWQMVITPSI